MTLKSKRSIRRKLTGIIMLTSTTAVLLACLGFAISDLVSLRNGLASDLSTLAQVVGTNSIAALTFGDHQGAREVLNALEAKPSIVAAGIYTDRGEPFAQYEPNASITIPRVLPKDGFHDRGERLELIYPMRLRHHRIGTLYIVSDSRDRNARLKHDVEIAALIVLVALLFAFVLSSRLQRNISVPIVELARVADLVSQHKNYSARANPRRSNHSDEIDHLMTGFNSMLAEIEQRDDRLLLSRNAAERAAAVNAQLARESALILNSATDGIIGIGLDNQATFLNPAATQMLGMSLSELEGQSIHEAIRHSHADGTRLEQDCPSSLGMRLGQSFELMDDTFWRQDGTSFPVEYSSRPMFDEDGTQRGAVVVFRDVTERRAIERLKSEFVSTVSHELRTPLTSIRGALGLLSSGLLGPLQEKGQRMLEIAVSNTDRLVRLINDILDLERIGSGKVELAHAPVDAHIVMVQASQGLQSMANEAGIHLVVSPASGTLLGDSDRIIQTLTNLIGNAIKFSLAGTTVTVSGTARQADFAFCVADQGRGVPEEKLETIFERFSQVDASDSRDKGGTGLGLAICKSIVHAHGGRVWAEKNDPVGSRFRFTIPLAAPLLIAQTVIEVPNSANLEMTQEPDRRSTQPSVLIVEDDLDLARVMTMALQGRGIRTHHAVTGGEAIWLCSQHEPSLIVLDPGHPDIDGFAVIAALRESTRFSGLPLIVYSALDIEWSDRSRLCLGPTEFLTQSRCTLPDFESHLVRLLEIVSNPEKEGQHAA
jgi:PAS domain S-box-containing protein